MLTLWRQLIENHYCFDAYLVYAITIHLKHPTTPTWQRMIIRIIANQIYLQRKFEFAQFTFRLRVHFVKHNNRSVFSVTIYVTNNLPKNVHRFIYPKHIAVN